MQLGWTETQSLGLDTHKSFSATWPRSGHRLTDTYGNIIRLTAGRQWTYHKMSHARDSRTLLSYDANHTHLVFFANGNNQQSKLKVREQTPTQYRRNRPTYILIDSSTENFRSHLPCVVSRKTTRIQRDHYMETWREVSAGSALLHC